MNDRTISTKRRRIERSVDLLGSVERYLAAILMIAMTGLYAFNVLVRWVAPTYASTFAWIDEGSRYMMIWVAFLAAGLTLEVGRHVSVDIVHGVIPKRALYGLFAIIDIVGVIFCAWAAYISLRLAFFVAGTGQISPTLGVPTYVLYVAPFVGFLSLTIRFVLRLTAIRDVRRSPHQPEWLGGGHS